jgi:hypothetical protein
MSTLDQATNTDMTGYSRATPPQAPQYVPPYLDENVAPRYNPMLRTPLPPSNSSPDAQRNFYQVGKFPQMRIASPTVQSSVGSSLTQVTRVSGTSSSSSSSTIVTTSSQQEQVASVVTSPLGVGAEWQGTVSMAKLVTIKVITVNNPARVRVYSTKVQQVTDAPRGDTTTVLSETQHGVIVDLFFPGDDGVFSWILSPAAVGGNCDQPDSAALYVTVDNIGGSSTPITVSFSYVGEES